MQNVFRMTAWIALSALLAAPLHAQSLPDSLPVTQQFSEAALKLPQGAGELVIYSAILGRGEVKAVCGLVVPSRAAVGRHAAKIMRKTWLKEGNRKILRDLSYFTRLKAGTDPMGQPAACKPVKTTGKGGFSFGNDPTALRM